MPKTQASRNEQIRHAPEKNHFEIEGCRLGECSEIVFPGIVWVLGKK